MPSRLQLLLTCWTQSLIVGMIPEYPSHWPAVLTYYRVPWSKPIDTDDNHLLIRKEHNSDCFVTLYNTSIINNCTFFIAGDVVFINKYICAPGLMNYMTVCFFFIAVAVCLLTYFTPTFFWVLSWRRLASGKGWPELLEWQWTGWRCDQWLSSAGRVWYRLWWRRKREVQLLWGCVSMCVCGGGEGIDIII